MTIYRTVEEAGTVRIEPMDLTSATSAFFARYYDPMHIPDYVLVQFQRRGVTGSVSVREHPGLRHDKLERAYWNFTRSRSPRAASKWRRALGRLGVIHWRGPRYPVRAYRMEA